MERATREELLTVEDLLQLPDDDIRHELVEGFLLSEPPAFFNHGTVAGEVFRLLSDFVHARGLGVVLSADTGFLLARAPDTVRAPDVAFVSRDRVRAVRNVRAFFPGAPDLAVEVLSSMDRPGEVRAKVADYLAGGARLVWVIDPARDRVIVYRTLLAPRVVTRDGNLDGGDVLPGFSVPVGDLFQYET